MHYSNCIIWIATIIFQKKIITQLMVKRVELILILISKLLVFLFTKMRKGIIMINVSEQKSASLVKAEEQLQKATNRLKEEKKKANEENRKQENHNKIIMGGIVKKYFPECIYFEQHELERILKSAINSEQCKAEIVKIKNECSESKKCNNTVPEGRTHHLWWCICAHRENLGD